MPCARSSRSSGWGMVNGWCAGIGRPSSSSASNSGKSTTQRNCEPTLVHRRAAELDPQRAEHVVDEPARPGGHEQQVARLARRACRRCRAARPPTGTSAPGTRARRRRRTRIHTRPPAPSCLARSTSLSTCARDMPPSPGSRMPFTDVGLEGAELGGGEHLAEVDELEAEAHVGLVGAVALLRLVPGHARHRARARRR